MVITFRGANRIADAPSIVKTVANNETFVVDPRNAQYNGTQKVTRVIVINNTR